jgi:hypothetical protein
MKKLNQLLGMAALAAMVTTAQGQTILSGNISGTWSPSGNPYIISDNATVQSGQTLTIQPGVNVWIGSGVSITVNGAISAVGTAAQRITFKAPVNSQYWNTFSVNNSFMNLFNYCDFANATNALAFVGTGTSNQVSYCTFTNVMGTALAFNNQSGNQVLFSGFQSVSNGIAMKVNANNWTLNANIANCSFSNCWGTAASGIGNGNAGYNGMGGCWASTGTIVATIVNCSFSSVVGGCSFNINGVNYAGCVGYGYGNIQLLDNIFQHVTNTAISLAAGSYSASSPATLLNNIIVNASNGVVFQDPWDAKMQNSILVGCTNAVAVSGSLSRSVSYNDLFNNAIDFTGYPSTYGTVIFANRNGTPCDLLYNIFSNPLFVSANDFSLQANSPCIDAGDGSSTNYDSYFPPSQGTVLNDMGAYGGPNAGGWIYSSPTTTFTLSILPYVGVTINPPSAGHYELDYASRLTGTNNWFQLTNMDLTGPFTYVEPASNPQRHYRAVKLY